MLILTRRIGETIRIDNNITCRVIEINCNQVRIGIEAPRNIDVHREEIWLRINQEEKVN